MQFSLTAPAARVHAYVRRLQKLPAAADRDGCLRGTVLHIRLVATQASPRRPKKMLAVERDSPVKVERP
jgi:hypothetical protein